MIEQRCPLCGKPNAQERETCLFCGARLAPLVGSGQSSQPDGSIPGAARDPGDDGKPGESSLPDWIKALREGEDRVPQDQKEVKKPHFGSSPGIPIRGRNLEPGKAQKDDAVPDWLAGLRSLASPAGDDTPGQGGETNQPGTGNGIKEEQSFPAPAAPQAEDDSTPDWLARLGGEPAGEPHEDIKPGETLPEWIRKLQPEEKPVQETGPQETDEFPVWLEQLPSIDAVESAAGSDDEFGTHPQADADTPKTQRELVDWFSQLESGGKSPGRMEVGADEIAPGKTSKPATGADEIPVGDAEGSGEIKAGEKETGKPYTATEAEIPDWLSSLGAGEKSEERSEPEISPGGAGQAELPAWVQALRPVETLLPGSDMPEAEENRKTETLGPLAGLAGVLPNVTAGGTAHKPPVLQAKLQISSNQQKYAAQLEKMIQEEGQAKPRKPQGINPSRVLRWILSIILIGAVLLPLLSGGTYTPEMGLFPQEWGETNQLLREIPGRSTLLVVLDYDPALAGELEAAAAPVIKNLLSRDAHLVLISTTPVGPALGERLLVASQPITSPPGKAYTNLGYLAGGQAGIQFLASDPRKAVQATTDGGPAWDTPALAGIQRLSDFGALIILTDNADTGRAWIEQTSSAIGDTPLLMIISAQAEPLIRPYFDSGQVGGLITGLMGGKTYEQTYATPGTARRYWDAFGSGLMAAVILVAAGSLWSAGKSLNNRRKAGTEK